VEHTIDRHGETVEFIGVVARCQAHCQISLHDSRRSAADFVHLVQKSSMTKPADDPSEQQHDDCRRANAIPEALDQRFKANALATYQEMISAGKFEVRRDNSHLRSVPQSDHES